MNDQEQAMAALENTLREAKKAEERMAFFRGELSRAEFEHAQAEQGFRRALKALRDLV